MAFFSYNFSIYLIYSSCILIQISLEFKKINCIYHFSLDISKGFVSVCACVFCIYFLIESRAGFHIHIFQKTKEKVYLNCPLKYLKYNGTRG